MTEDDDTDGEDGGDTTYDPVAPTPPAREPPYRSTAPQSDYTMGQVALGFLVFVVGGAITFGLPLVMG